MDARIAIAFAGGACAGTAFSGACAALTSSPPALLVLTGAALAAIAFAGDRRAGAGATRSALVTCAGLIAALLLPTTAPPAPGGVRQHAPSLGLSGDLFAALDRLDEDPGAVAGRRISVSGIWTPAGDGRDATVSRRVMSCCVADAVDVGFDVRLARPQRIARGAWVRIDGVVRDFMLDGERRVVLDEAVGRRVDQCKK